MILSSTTVRMAILLVAALVFSQDAAVGKAERFSAILAAGALTSQAAPVDIGVERWSSDADRIRLFELYESGGQAALAQALDKASAVGYVLLRNHQRLIAGYAQEEVRPDGGRRILLLCVRHPGDWEMNGDLGWTDHLFRIVALTLDAKGRGTGMLFHTAKVKFVKDGPDLIDELSGQPTKLLSVQTTR